MTRTALFAACLSLFASSAPGQTQHCDGTVVSVTSGDTGAAALVCGAAQKAQTLFAECAIPALSRPVNVDLTTDLPRGCMGLYHCGEDRIEVLPPDAMTSARSPASVFAYLTTEKYFQSIVVHELTHAATDAMPCPFEHCVVGPEYISYLMQVMSLDPVDLARFEDSYDKTTPVTNEDLNPFVLVLAPDYFAQYVWAYHWQRDDPCGFVAQLQSGKAVLDVEFYDGE